MQKFFEKSFYTKPVLQKIIQVTLTLSFVLIFITFSLNLTDVYESKSIWGFIGFKDVVLADLYISLANFFPVIANLFILAFIVNAFFYGISIWRLYKQRTKSLKVIEINIYFNIIIILVLFITNKIFSLYNFGLWFILILTILINGVSLFAFKAYNDEPKEAVNLKEKLDFSKTPKYIFYILDIVSLVILLLIFIVPLFNISGLSIFIVDILNSKYALIEYQIVGLSFFVLLLGSIGIYLSTIISTFQSEQRYFKRSLLFHRYNLIIMIVFFLVCFGFVFFYKIYGNIASTIAYIPLIIYTVFYVFYTYIRSRIDIVTPVKKPKEKENKKLKLIPLLFVFVFTLITFSSLFLKLIVIELEIESLDLYNIIADLTGGQLLRDYYGFDEIFQAVAFLYALILFSSLTLMVLCLTKFFGEKKEYYKTIKSTVNANLIFIFLFVTVGFFFRFNQKYVDINIQAFLDFYKINLPLDYNYTISSSAKYLFIAAIAVFIVMVLTGYYNIQTKEEPVLEKAIASSPGEPQKLEIESKAAEPESFDQCPAFTELDNKQSEFASQLRERQRSLFSNPTLPKLVEFVINYASNSRLHLSYSYQDMATFVAGLGTSKLAILQGMSGTGKTSLPKIFLEAIMGNCEIVEVESSWRDKHELLGYYNEFTQRYTPKKFTQSLYKASLNPNVPTFIVLDEMNLSRIEYYFSDFLSLLEDEEDKQKIKLVNLQLSPGGVNGKMNYSALEEGHTIKIPKNLWFIGTANRDESTFEISDKVYDRAMTIDFYKRAPKVRVYEEEMEPLFLPYNTLRELFEEGKNKIEFDVENDPVIKEVEEILMPYNISFGNRILRHMEDFVKIYYACYLSQHLNMEEVLKDAVEIILLSKVVSKLALKQIDNREKLANSFDKLQLYKCSAFIRRLAED